MDDKEPYWYPARRGEWRCVHGVGHRGGVHGCCHAGCCGREDFPPRVALTEWVPAKRNGDELK